MIVTVLQHVLKSNNCAMVSILLCHFGGTGDAFICAERFMDTGYLWGEIANIRLFRVTLLAIKHLCMFGKLNALCTVQEID